MLCFAINCNTFFALFWCSTWWRKRLLLALCSEITLRRLRGPHRKQEIKPRLASCKAKALSFVLLLKPNTFDKYSNTKPLDVLTDFTN